MAIRFNPIANYRVGQSVARCTNIWWWTDPQIGLPKTEGDILQKANLVRKAGDQAFYQYFDFRNYSAE